MGFDGSDDEWHQEFSTLCHDAARLCQHDVLGQAGLSLSNFQALLNDESETGCNCSDTQLQKLLRATSKMKTTKTARRSDSNIDDERHIIEVITSDFRQQEQHPEPQNGEHITGPKLQLQQQHSVPEILSGRAALVTALFDSCDEGGDGRLDMKGMWNFAQKTGFSGSPQDWAEEYHSLCADKHADPEVGISKELFRHLLDDNSEGGCFCSDEELQSMLAVKEPKPYLGDATDLQGAFLLQEETGLDSHPQRSTILLAVFNACDLDMDNRLSEEELLSFADLTGFQGGKQEWANEYRQICSEYSVDAIDLNLFQRLLDDASENGLYCSTADLLNILFMLQPNYGAPAGAAG
eukprot:TRINITY_DN109515_c0_g1_i1.p1 TRINITY_DN109515_c0_g1~~TRINITY_DN109515_c0_g1_i1.p1  ORF type:complete len:351 (-),score=88.69 TRINITY_DN109515_c0_g1_i1:818-1870(-)